MRIDRNTTMAPDFVVGGIRRHRAMRDPLQTRLTEWMRTLDDPLLRKKQ